MTDEELDLFFIETLGKILKNVKEYRDYVKDLNTAEYREIKAYYDDEIELLSSLINKVKCIEDLAEYDEETITAVYDYIADFADNFIIAADDIQRKKDLAEYEKLEELMALFLDADEDYEEEED